MKLDRFLESAQDILFIALLTFAPLAVGGTPRWALILSSWVGASAVVTMVLRRAWTDRSYLPRSRLDRPLLLLIILAMFTTVYSIVPFASRWAMVRLLLYIAVYYLALDAVRSTARTKLLVFSIIGAGAVLVLIGLVKYAGGPLPDFWNYQVGGQEKYLTSTFFNHNHLAGFLSMAFTLGLGLFLSGAVTRPVILIGILATILLGLILAMSRGSWLSTLAAVIGMALAARVKYGKIRAKLWWTTVGIIVLTGAIFVGSIPALKRLQSLGDEQISVLTERTTVWWAAGELIRRHPFGTGIGTFPWAFPEVRPAGVYARWREAHNDYVQVLVELGWGAAVPIIWAGFIFYRTVLTSFFRTRSKLREGLTLGSLGAVTSMAIHGLSDFNMQITANGMLFFTITGLGAGVTRDRHSPADPENQPAPISGQINFIDSSGNQYQA